MRLSRHTNSYGTLLPGCSPQPRQARDPASAGGTDTVTEGDQATPPGDAECPRYEARPDLHESPSSLLRAHFGPPRRSPDRSPQLARPAQPLGSGETNIRKSQLAKDGPQSPLQNLLSRPNTARCDKRDCSTRCQWTELPVISRTSNRVALPDGPAQIVPSGRGGGSL